MLDHPATWIIPLAFMDEALGEVSSKARLSSETVSILMRRGVKACATTPDLFLRIIYMPM